MSHTNTINSRYKELLGKSRDFGHISLEPEEDTLLTTHRG